MPLTGWAQLGSFYPQGPGIFLCLRSGDTKGSKAYNTCHHMACIPLGWGWGERLETTCRCPICCFCGAPGRWTVGRECWVVCCVGRGQGGLSAKGTLVQKKHMDRCGDEQPGPGGSRSRGPELGGSGLDSLKASWRLLPMGQGECRRRHQGLMGPQALEDLDFSSESGGSHWGRLSRWVMGPNLCLKRIPQATG